MSIPTGAVLAIMISDGDCGYFDYDSENYCAVVTVMRQCNLLCWHRTEYSDEHVVTKFYVKRGTVFTDLDDVPAGELRDAAFDLMTKARGRE